MEPSHPLVELIHEVVEWSALGIEVLAVAVIVAGVALVAFKRGTVRYLFKLSKEGAFESYRNQLARPLLLGLELLVAADVVKTVFLEQTIENVAALGLLVVVRTFLSWSMSVEMERRWPWQGKPDTPRNGSHQPESE